MFLATSKASLVISIRGVYASAQTQPGALLSHWARSLLRLRKASQITEASGGLLRGDTENFELMLMWHELLQWNKKPDDKEMKRNNKKRRAINWCLATVELLIIYVMYTYYLGLKIRT